MSRARLLAALAVLALPARAALPAPADILARTDEIRNPRLDYRVTVTVTSQRPGREDRRSVYEVLVKGRDRTLIKTLEPANERGVLILMRGKDLWTFLPDLAQPVRISLQQRLLGEIAIGDVARADFTGDYAPRLIAEKKEGVFLDLKAVEDSVTYGRVTLQVRSGDFFPLKANFYAVSGKLLKRCVYERPRDMAGRSRPSRLVMNDPLVKGQRTILEYDRLEETPLEERLFSKDRLKKLSD